ncbi:MAG: acetyl-CoA carboxylase biotin carboxyl carrier protein [Hormoscilla sp. GM7CHS1pb]|nr:acetyl-CoA carboxylase biotin carboxyl carrier protein [Hormoscilla sp. GM7CHS1pb]
MELNFNELRELIAALDQTDIAELRLKSADFELTLRKATVKTEGGVAPVGAAVARTAAVVTAPPVDGSGGGREPVAPAEGARSVEKAPSATVGTGTGQPLAEKKWAEIKSPMVGTFYHAPAPGEAPFVQVGDRINAGQVVCIIEAMKLMNEIEAEVSGRVMEIMVENGEPVDFDKPLMRIDPNG